MSAHRMPVTAVLAAGVGLGLAGNLLLRAPGAPGLNFTLLFAGLALSVLLVSLDGGPPLSREAAVWMGVGVLFGTALLWRGSELLRFLAFVAAATAFALPALHAGKAWVRRAGVVDLLEAVGASGLHAVLGSVRLLQRDRWEAVGSEESRLVARSVARSVVVGVLLAVAPLFVFGALFISADPVFARMVQELVGIDLEELASHLVVSALLSWLACGYLAGFASGTRLDRVREIGWVRPSLRGVEVATAVALVDLLFLAFVVVQFRYLFGGSEMVEVTPGLTYATYAREGFFQLVAATALGLPWLLVADGLLGGREGPTRWTFRALAGGQLLLLLAIVASAVQRMRAYLDAYGLTEDRFVAMAVLGWLALLVLWFGTTVLRGRRARFAFGALMSAFALVAVLQVADPAALAARSHLDRSDGPVGTRPGTEARPDVEYLASLGSDAAPILVERLDELGPDGRCRVARRLLSRWGPEAESDWRSWNLADRTARRAVREHTARLQAVIGQAEACG